MYAPIVYIHKVMNVGQNVAPFQMFVRIWFILTACFCCSFIQQAGTSVAASHYHQSAALSSAYAQQVQAGLLPMSVIPGVHRPVYVTDTRVSMQRTLKLLCSYNLNTDCPRIDIDGNLSSEGHQGSDMVHRAMMMQYANPCIVLGMAKCPWDLTLHRKLIAI